MEPGDINQGLTMTEITYRVFSSQLLGCGFTDKEVDYYADKLAKVLASKLGHIGAIEVVRVDRESGGRPVRIYTDNDDLDIYSLETRVREIANIVFDVVAL
jgi:hypothetical protein